eukprot:scpid32884/ scgid24569/ 
MMYMTRIDENLGRCFTNNKFPGSTQEDCGVQWVCTMGTDSTVTVMQSETVQVPNPCVQVPLADKTKTASDICLAMVESKPTWLVCKKEAIFTLTGAHSEGTNNIRWNKVARTQFTLSPLFHAAAPRRDGYIRTINHLGQGRKTVRARPRPCI